MNNIFDWWFTDFQDSFISIMNSQGAVSSCPETLDEIPEPKFTLFRRNQVVLGFQDPAEKEPSPGLININNSCFLNATLQVFN